VTRSSATRLVIGFAAAGVVVTLGLAVAIALVARQQAIEVEKGQVAEIASITARGVVEPRVSDGLLRGDPEAVAAVDDAVRTAVLSDSLVRVKIWDGTGRVVYSDDGAQVGQVFPLDDGELAALTGVDQRAGVNDTSEPENASEAPFGRLLEIYTGIRTPTGTPLLYEAYFRYDAVAQAGWDSWRAFAPPAVGALLLLELVQIPLAVVLARRLQGRERQRERLLRHAVGAATAERRRIAGDLHDGVVQELTGITYGLDASRMKGDDPQRAEVVADAARRLRETVGSLRTLLVDIYPPNLAEEGLDAALQELAAGLRRRGMAVAVDLDAVETVAPDQAALLYRAAQEALRNVVSHSGAEHVGLSVAPVGTGWLLTVTDDGRGFDPGARDEHARSGHLGLRSIADLLVDAGGELTIDSAPGAGSRVEARVVRT
jgi:two-component system, NarL family, sensor kinase